MPHTSRFYLFLYHHWSILFRLLRLNNFNVFAFSLLTLNFISDEVSQWRGTEMPASRRRPVPHKVARHIFVRNWGCILASVYKAEKTSRRQLREIAFTFAPLRLLPAGQLLGLPCTTQNNSNHANKGGNHWNQAYSVSPQNTWYRCYTTW